ncbi:MAG: Hsp20/alpha crystallin family protein [Pseudomonadota bacterium]
MKDDATHVATAPAVDRRPALSPFDAMRREMEQLISAPQWPGHGLSPSQWPNQWPGMAQEMTRGRAMSPALDLSEGKDAYELTLELPGVGADDIELKVAQGRLAIRGEKREENRREDGDRLVSERRYGQFARSLTLPEDVDEAGVSADFTDGVLKIRLPKSETARASERRIEIARR